MNDFAKYLTKYSKEVTKDIFKIFEEDKYNNSSLFQAIKYVIEVGGKRLRPILVLEFSKIFGVDFSYAIRVASSIELIHCYSLVHDDLPAMDNDDLRRGSPTCHIKFDEATAILVGDALQSYAFEILSDKKTHPDPKIRCDLVNQLAKSSGMNGMVGGQKLDLEAGKKNLNIEDIKKLQKLKTGELFKFSCISPCILAKAKSDHFKILEKYSSNLGLAFQIQDDILDIEGTTEMVGKKINKDQSMGKQTFITIFGLDLAKKKANDLIEEAIDILKVLGKESDTLIKVTQLVVSRTY